MSNRFCVNKSGYSVPVWSGPGFANVADITRIGSIGNREAFSFVEDWGGDGVFNCIQFLNSSGQLSYGWLSNRYENGNAILANSDWNNVFTECTDYPYGYVTIDGKTYKTFKFRRAEEVYTPSGDNWGAVASGCRVACQTALAGSSHPSWKGINYVERSTDGAWIKVTSQSGEEYGYVDTGLNTGSGPSTISMYGTW